MREIQYYFNTSREAQCRGWYCLLARLYQMPSRVKPYIAEVTPALETWQLNGSLQSYVALGDIFVWYDDGLDGYQLLNMFQLRTSIFWPSWLICSKRSVFEDQGVDCDIMVYNKKYVFGLYLCSWPRPPQIVAISKVEKVIKMKRTSFAIHNKPLSAAPVLLTRWLLESS